MMDSAERPEQDRLRVGFSKGKGKAGGWDMAPCGCRAMAQKDFVTEAVRPLDLLVRSDVHASLASVRNVDNALELRSQQCSRRLKADQTCGGGFP
jgi:hypothetical protein